jgi:hypothetical protein
VRDAVLSPGRLQVLDEDRYEFAVPHLGIWFEVDRLRRKGHELLCELTVKCDVAGARAVDGVLSAADFNLSSARARQERAKLCAERARIREVDWLALFEELCQRVIAAERAGQPAVVLRELPRPAPDEELDVHGFRFPRRHPTILFGDGGVLKSLTALYVAGALEQLRGIAVAFVDWELDGSAHRDRLERLFGRDMPAVRYVRCDRPLVYEVDRLKRVVRDAQVEFAIFDSVAFACDGPPESAEVAAAYFRAVRQIGIGSLHVAHITKGDNGDQKPFGSVFWHNGARSTWFAKLAGSADDGRCQTIGLFNRKSNLGPLRRAVGFDVTFDAERTAFTRVNVAEVGAIAVELPIWQRVQHELRAGPQTYAALADRLDESVDSVEKAVKRKLGKLFTRLTNTNDGVHRIALLERRAS